MEKITIVSVARDFAMYGKCLAANPCVAGCRRVVIDNSSKNEPIPVLYNRFLEKYDYLEDSWFVFCHEDFEPQVDLRQVTRHLSHDAIWGPIGAKTIVRWCGWCTWVGVGHITMANKDGTDATRAGVMHSPQELVETLDCCCMMVHSSLVNRFGLRFDDKLSFDLYVEDFCIAAKELYGIASMAVDFPCTHYSKAAPQKRYEVQHRYLNHKWKDVSYSSPCSWNIGGKFGPRMIVAALKEFARRVM